MTEPISGISVSGVGEAGAPPDTLEIDLAISVRRDTVAAATSDAAVAAEALIDSLKSRGIGSESITTTNYSIQPEYDYRNDTQRLLGYRVNNAVKAVVRDIGAAGEIVDAATAAAGDVVTVNGISFRVEAGSELLQTAREAAWQDALAKGRQLARLAGKELGPVVSIVESEGRPPTPFPRASLAMADRATPLEPGSATLSVLLQVHFAFAD